MKKYEYLEMQADYAPIDTRNAKLTLTKEPMQDRVVDEITAQHLNDYGEQGWKVIHVRVNNDNQIEYALLEREKSEEEDEICPDEQDHPIYRGA